MAPPWLHLPHRRRIRGREEKRTGGRKLGGRGEDEERAETVTKAFHRLYERFNVVTVSSSAEILVIYQIPA